MHYLMWSDSVDEVSFWDDYVQVNQIFANEAVANYQEGDVSKFLLDMMRIHRDKHAL